MRKFLSLFTVLMLLCALAYAQNRTVRGTVRDEKGIPVPFATVTIKGTKLGTSADASGNFSIEVKDGATLVVSSTGFQIKEVGVQGQNQLNIQLAGSANLIDEVIVTAGGIKARRKEIGMATSVVKAESLTAGKAVNVAGGLQGKVAGLQISGTSSGVNPSFRVILRGQRSLTGNNQALLVLDNVIVPNEVLGNLNPDDVEEITVLNGAGAAALYGSQASNGAIIVTTKKGKRGVTSVGISQTTTIESVAFFPKIQKKFGAGGTAYGVDANGNPTFSYLENQSYGPAFDGTMQPLGPPLEDGRQDSARYQYNDGHFKFWEKGLTNQSDINFTTGDENSTFYMSGQYVDVSGTTPGDKYNRAAFRLNGTRKVGSKINITYTAGYTQNRYDITTQTGAMYGNMLNMPSNVDITRYKNWRTDPFANPIGYYNPWYLNPYFSADNYRSNQRNDYLIGNLEVRFSPVHDLDLVARQGITTRNYSNKNTVAEFKYTEYSKHTDASSKSDIPGSVSDGSSYRTQLVSDLFAQYNKRLNDFTVTFVAGGQWTHQSAKDVDVSASGLVVPDLFNTSNGVGTPGASESNYKARQIGAYGDLRIGYKGFLYLHGTGRNDWVSILAPENRSFFYPSVDLSLIASDVFEPLKESNVISYLKLRGGWSKVGQVNLRGGLYGAYQLSPTVSPNAYGFPYGSLAGYTVDNNLVSNNLKPEMTKGYEAGFDLNLFRDRFTSNFTYFSTKTDDQTVSTRISNTTGFTNLLTNTGQTQSKGIEATAHVTPLRSGDWTIIVGGNYTYLDNKVNSISTDLPRLSLATYGTDGAGSYAIAGRVFPVIMGFDYQRDDQGRVIVDRISGLPTKSDTISILGNATPKHRLGVDGTVKWKNLSLSFLFDYRGSYQVYHNIGREMDWSGTGYRTGVYNRQRFVFPNSVYWDGSKYVENTDITIKNGNGNNGFWSDGINRDINSNYVTSGDFWKLRELSIAYDFPAGVLSKTKIIKGARISIQGRNLFMWMAKDNYYTDPEYSDAGNDSNGIGLTGIGQTPPSRFYGATVSLKF